MSDQELKELVVSLVKGQQEAWKQIKETSKQLGGLGNKFGRFTEGMAFPSMEKVLRERFQMDVFATRVKARKNGPSGEPPATSF